MDDRHPEALLADFPAQVCPGSPASSSRAPHGWRPAPPNHLRRHGLVFPRYHREASPSINRLELFGRRGHPQITRIRSELAGTTSILCRRWLVVLLAMFLFTTARA